MPSDGPTQPRGPALRRPDRAARLPGRGSAVLLLVLAFAAGSSLASRTDRLTDLKNVGRSLHHLETEGDQYDLVFFGSSRFMRGIEVNEVDRAMAEHGLSVRSFNMSHQGAYAYEVYGLMRRLYGRANPVPRFVVIELRSPQPGLRSENLWKPRTTFWHTPEVTALAASDAWTWRGAPLWERPALAWLHVRHMAQDLLGTGRGSLLLARALDPPGLPRDLLLTEERRGFVPYTVAAMEREPRQRFEHRYARFRQRVERLVRTNASGRAPRPAFVRLVESEIAFLRARGIEPVFVVMPSNSRPSDRERNLARSGVVPTLLAYDDPERYGFLYDLEQRYDSMHLNAQGARRFSRLLGRDLAEQIQAHERRDGTR